MSNAVVNNNAVNNNNNNNVMINNEVPNAVIDDSIRAEARRRLEEIQARERQEAETRRLQEEEAINRYRLERIRQQAEEELVRQNVREAEARRQREAAIQAEITRLRNRPQIEVLEDRVTQLERLLNANANANRMV